MEMFWRPLALLFLLSVSQFASANPTVCMVGDSVVARGGEWRNVLYQDTKAINHITLEFLGNNTDGSGYQHDGVGGDTTEDVWNRIDGYINSDGVKVGPIPVCDITILHVGGNDLLQMKLWPKDIAANVLKIANRLTDRGSKVYIGTVLPAHDVKWKLQWNQYIALINYHIKEGLKEQANCRLNLVDHWSAFTSAVNSGTYLEYELYADAVHPSKTGYIVLATQDRSVLFPAPQ